MNRDTKIGFKHSCTFYHWSIINYYLCMICSGESSDEETEVVSQRSGFNDLPYEVQLNVVSYLSPRDLARCAQVSQGWNLLALDGSLWFDLHPVSWAKGFFLTFWGSFHKAILATVDLSYLRLILWLPALIFTSILWNNYKTIVKILATVDLISLQLIIQLPALIFTSVLQNNYNMIVNPAHVEK